MNRRSGDKVTLADVLRLALPLNTRLVGAQDADRVATWVAILTEFGSLQHQIQPGDIVIAPPIVQDQVSEGELCDGLEEMADLSVAALLLFRPVSGKVLSQAESRDLPILMVPEDVSLRDVHQNIAGLLVDRQKQIAERGMQLYRRLTEMSREDLGLEAMTEVMARLTGKVVVVQDKRLDTVALGVPEESDVDAVAVRAALDLTDHLPGPLRNRKTAAAAGQSHWQQLLPVGEGRMARLISPIISGDRARGYVSVIGPPDALDLLDALTAEHGAAACALEMAKVKAISEVKKELRGNFLEGLLAGTLPEKEVLRLAGRLDHDTNCRHAILTLAWDGNSSPSMRRLETPLNWLLSSHNRPALVHVYSHDHVCVFQALADEDDDLGTALELARRLREHLRVEFPKSRLLAGLSGPADGLAEWPLVYQQAVQAMRLAGRLHADSTVTFDSLGIYQLLVQLEDEPSARRFSDQIVGPLATYDKRHRSSLMQTIIAYFHHHGNVSQTADALYVHRNTLSYRLDRIQDLTGQNLENPDERLALQLALKLWQVRPETDASGRQ
ncbi:MAG: helix-turn-helix domain-containing protein [Chloroflexota bacterium]|nr:MAG: helix-turn-helix domain-containing protein [Chloroflexota bacterium]